MEILAESLKYRSGSAMRALFPRHSGYTGCLGAYISGIASKLDRCGELELKSFEEVISSCLRNLNTQQDRGPDITSDAIADAA